MRRFARPATVLLLASLLPYRIQGQESKVPKVTTVADAGGVVIPDVGTTGVLRAGAARIEITPATHARLHISGYDEPGQIEEGVHDPLYVRALVVDDGRERAAIVTCEILYITNEMWEATSRRVSEQVGIRPQNLMLTAVHTHGAPKLESNVGGKPVLTSYVGTVED